MVLPRRAHRASGGTGWAAEHSDSPMPHCSGEKEAYQTEGFLFHQLFERNSLGWHAPGGARDTTQPSCEHAAHTGCSTASAAVHYKSVQEGNTPHQTHREVPHLQNSESRTLRVQRTQLLSCGNSAPRTGADSSALRTRVLGSPFVTAVAGAAGRGGMEQSGPRSAAGASPTTVWPRQPLHRPTPRRYGSRVPSTARSL